MIFFLILLLQYVLYNLFLNEILFSNVTIILIKFVTFYNLKNKILYDTFQMLFLLLLIMFYLIYYYFLFYLLFYGDIKRKF